MIFSEFFRFLDYFFFLTVTYRVGRWSFLFCFFLFSVFFGELGSNNKKAILIDPPIFPLFNECWLRTYLASQSNSPAIDQLGETQLPVMVWSGSTSNCARSDLSFTTTVSRFTYATPPLFYLPSPHTCPNRVTPLNMDITGHFESASCVIEVDGSDTLAQVKGKLLAELGVPHARRIGVRMKGGGDIGDDDLRICDTEMDEGCAVELYSTGLASITPGVLPDSGDAYILTLSPCDRYLAVVRSEDGVSIFDTETHERLCHFSSEYIYTPSFSPCSRWISCVNKDTECAEVHDVETGALKHSFGEAGDDRKTTAWSPCGTMLLSWSSKGLQVWDIAAGVVVHEWSHIVGGDFIMVVGGDRVAVCSEGVKEFTLWDYTTGEEVRVLTCPAGVNYMALSPDQRWIAACCNKCVRVWNIETAECVFETSCESDWTDVAVSNDRVAAYSSQILRVWEIPTQEKVLDSDAGMCNYGLAMSSCGGAVMYGRESVEIVDI